MRSLHFFSILFAFSVLITSCGEPHHTKLTNPNEPPPSQEKGIISANSLVGYDLLDKTALNSCRDCHSGRVSPNLSDLGRVAQNLPKILEEVEHDEMPRTELGYRPLTACEKSLLKRWSELGAPVQSNEKVSSVAECKDQVIAPPVTEAPLSQLAATYENLYNRVLRSKCASCHAEGAPSDAADLAIFPETKFLSHPTWFRADKSGQMKLIHAISRTDNRRMPPPPEEDDKTSKDQSLTFEELGFVTRYLTLTGLANQPVAPKPPEPTTDPNIPLNEAPVNYETLYSRILQPKCIKCHSSISTSGAADFAVFPYENLVNLKTWFLKDEDSPDGALTKVMFAVSRTDNDRMPPKPKPNDPNGKDNPLTADEQNYLDKWINAGKPK